MKTCTYLSFDADGCVYCENPCEGNSEFCASHNRLIRKEQVNAIKSAEKRKQLLSKPKKIYAKPNKVSDKRKELNKEYFKLVEQFKKDNPKCKANVNEYCTKKTDDPHHTKGRGEHLLEVSTWLPVCRSCHSFIEANTKIAREKGWSESRLAVNEPHKI